MPGPTDDYFAYKRWFEAGQASLSLPAECVSPDPVLKYSNQYTWTLEWFLTFPDTHTHVRVWETFAKIQALQASRRISFAYHYGPTIRIDAAGMPDGEPSDPVFVRIDDIGGTVHLHPEGRPADHVPQDKISGLVLDQVDLFEFVKAVLRHRGSGKSIEKELRYRVKS